LDSGDYEIRLFRKDYHYDDTTFVTKVPFKVAELTDEERQQQFASIKIELDKAVYTPNDTIKVTTKGITDEMFNNRAFFATYFAGAAHNQYMLYRYPSAGTSTTEIDLYNSDCADFEMRLYSKDGQYDDTTFVASVPFKIIAE
jgi:hypothetical protein